MLDHLYNVSLFRLFENSAVSSDLVVLLGFLILGIDLTLTLTHSVQEYQGRLWRYFGAIAGLRIPDRVGITFFFVGLTAILWIVGFVGITGYCPGCESTYIPMAAIPMAAIGALVGGRLSDTLYSHVNLDREGYIDPEVFPRNPGLASTPFYVAEAIMLTVLFLPGLWSDG